MSAIFKIGLVVGKFAPLHTGHVHVVARATSLCQRVVIVSYSSPELEGYEPELRAAWLRDCFPRATVLVVTPELLAQYFPHSEVPTIPDNAASDASQREFVVMLCSRVLGSQVDAVFTSEDYGDGFATHLTQRFRAEDPTRSPVVSIMVDRERTVVPISGTELRKNLWLHWHRLPQSVAPSLVRRIAILGGESSGKSVLAARLAAELKTQCAAEFGRELWEAKHGQLNYDDMALIAEEQVRRENAASRVARCFVFCDTSPLTTLFYSLEMFGRAEPGLIIAAQREYSAVVLCAPDFPFVQDGTRRDDAFRIKQHRWYETELTARKISYETARGSVEARTMFVRGLLNLL